MFTWEAFCAALRALSTVATSALMSSSALAPGDGGVTLFCEAPGPTGLPVPSEDTASASITAASASAKASCSRSGDCSWRWGGGGGG